MPPCVALSLKTEATGSESKRTMRLITVATRLSTEWGLALRRTSSYQQAVPYTPTADYSRTFTLFFSIQKNKKTTKLQI